MAVATIEKLLVPQTLELDKLTMNNNFNCKYYSWVFETLKVYYYIYSRSNDIFECNILVKK